MRGRERLRTMSRPPRSLLREESAGTSVILRYLVVAGLALVLAIVSSASAGEKTDILVMDNGDKITGELKSVRQGQLSYKTDNLGTLTVNWDSVASLVSNKTVEVDRRASDQRVRGRQSAA